MNLSKRTKLTLVQAQATAATSTVETSSVDMEGWDGVIFFGKVATKATNNIATVEQSEDDASFAALAVATVTPTVNGNSFLIDVFRPLERYLRVSVARGTSTALGDIYALQYTARKMPPTQGSTIESILATSPAEA